MMGSVFVKFRSTTHKYKCKQNRRKDSLSIKALTFNARSSITVWWSCRRRYRTCVRSAPAPSSAPIPRTKLLRAGACQGTSGRHGLTDFIEHALFKGTRKRSAAQIAAEADALGGNLDAFTGREIVGFHDKVLDEHLPRAFELIADLVSSPAFD